MIIYLLALRFVWEPFFLWGSDKPWDVDGDVWTPSGPQVVIEVVGQF